MSLDREIYGDSGGPSVDVVYGPMTPEQAREQAYQARVREEIAFHDAPGIDYSDWRRLAVEGGRRVVPAERPVRNISERIGRLARIAAEAEIEPNVPDIAARNSMLIRMSLDWGGLVRPVNPSRSLSDKKPLKTLDLKARRVAKREKAGKRKEDKSFKLVKREKARRNESFCRNTKMRRRALRRYGSRVRGITPAMLMNGNNFGEGEE